ncbi:B12-binding domain-containing radical SAM protein [Chloroflexota bacterium]
MKQPILLINTNVARPPVSPVGLEYVGETLVSDGLPVQVLDLSFETDWKAALRRELESCEPLAVGLSVRNTDDCSFTSRKSFLPWIRDVVTEVRCLSQAYVILGGIGFSVMPEVVLKLTKADAGIAGDGEETMVVMARHLINGEDLADLPNLIYWCEGNVISNRRMDIDLRHLPIPRRRLFNNRRYEDLGAMVGIETKRGCPQQCIFCTDPVAKGTRMRLRLPSTVVQEFQDLFDQGVSWFHLCDSEFNLPITHAKEVCRAIIEAKLGDKLRWYTYCSPVPFDHELVDLMKRAGCCGINFGVDSLCDEQLFRLGRSHRLKDIEKLVHILKNAQMNYMFDLLIGGPGETERTVETSIGEVKRLDIPLAGIAAGVRVYPKTLLGRAIADGSITKGLYPQVGSLDTPLFYLSPYLGNEASSLIDDLVANDSRFLFLASPNDEQSYNYAGDEMLCQLIEKGARGAYWDIIRQSQRHRID